jgi:tetratricopeptide (TPR) repeat protein
MSATDNPSDEIDFFVSYTGKDKAWAEWIAWQLEHDGYRCLIQAWDFASGGVFPGDMHRALQKSARVIAVLSPAYMESGFCQPEWQAAFAADPTGEKGILVCVRVVNFRPDGLLRGRTYIDLVGLAEADAKTLLITRLTTGRAKPSAAPSFPGSASSTAAPSFPGGGAVASVASTTIPHNLPTLQPFFGREDELRKIADALDPDSRTWGALIDGPGGMGKTSLAVRAAYDASPEVFDKIVFVSLKTRELDDDGLRDLSGFILSGILELFNELARELGHADIAKSAEDKRPRLLLDALRGTKTLLILDNLESLLKRERDTLFTFVKKLPSGCKAILTSRGRIGSGAEELILEKLSQEAALATLAELATHNPLLAATNEAERLTLYRETGGKPLLLRWTAGQLGRGHCRSFTDALFFLRSCPLGNDPLEFIFGDLVEDFTPAETHALCALTYFTEAVKVEHVSVIAGLPETDTERALRSLTNRSLAVPNAELKSFALVPLVADFLRKKKPDLVSEKGDRLEDRAYALIIENGYQEHERFPVLEAAWPIIAPALTRFLTGDNVRLQTVCDALRYFLDFHGRWDECLALSAKAESRAATANDYKEAGWRAHEVGWIYYLRRQANPVLVCAERVTAHWAKVQIGAHERAFAIRLRGIGHELREDYAAAIAAYHESIELLRGLPDENVNVAAFLNNLAGAEMKAGDLVAAKVHFLEALEDARAASDAEGVAIFTSNLAELALVQEDWPMAEAYAREALPLSEAIRRQELIAMDNHRLAQALIRQGQAAEALSHARRAVEIFNRLGVPTLSFAEAILSECRNIKEAK